MPSNFTVDDFTPLIEYSGQWLDSFNLKDDPFTSRYRDSSFHSSRTDGSTAKFVFRGTGVYIFGAKRPNHGLYSVSVDGGTPKQFDGYEPKRSNGDDGLFQVPLFVQTGMADKKHDVVLTNIVNGDRPFVDIDFIIWTRSSDESFDNHIVENTGFEYSGQSTTWAATTDRKEYHGSSVHTTKTYGATAALQFTGREILVYGATGPAYGTYKVQLDGQPESEVTLNALSPISHVPALLYAASELDAGNHRILVTNTQEGKTLDIDYAEIVPHSGASGLTKGGIAGIVVGIVAGLALLTMAIWSFFIRRRRASRRSSMDLLGGAGSDDSQSPMRAYSVGLTQARVEPFISEPSGGLSRPSNETRGEAPSKPIKKPGMQGANVTNGYRETDAGALPPVYDEIVPGRVADAPVRNGL